MVTKAMIDDLKAREGDALRKYREAQNRLESACIEMEWQKSGLSQGDRVESDGKIYQAVNFTMHGTLVAHLVKKNGSLGAIHRLWRGWQKVE